MQVQEFKPTYSFRELDRQGDGTLDEMDVGKSSILFWNIFIKQQRDARATNKEARLKAIDDKIDQIAGSDGYISTGGYIFKDELAELKTYLSGLKYFDFDSVLSDSWLDAADESDKLPVYSISKEKIKKTLKESYAGIGGAVDFNNFDDIVVEGSEMANSLPRGIPVPTIETIENLLSPYLGKTIADVHDGKVARSANTPNVTVSEQEYAKWKIFKKLAGDDNYLKVCDGTLPSSVGGSRESSDLSVVKCSDNSEFKALVDSYGTGGRLNRAQLQALFDETEIRFNRVDKQGSSQNWIDYLAAQEKKGIRESFSTSAITQPGFTWSGTDGYNFYSLYNKYFKAQGVIPKNN